MNLITNRQRILYELFKQDFDESVGFADESQFFEFFAAKQILKKFDFNDEEVENGVLGNGNDGGCDAIYTLCNDLYITDGMVNAFKPGKGSEITLVIIQAKRETFFGEDAIMKWKTITNNLLELYVDDSVYSTRYNEDVLAAFALFRELYEKLLRNNPSLNIEFYYASFASEAHPNVRAQAQELQSVVRELFPSKKTSVKVHFWGAEELLSAVQSQSGHTRRLQLAEVPINMDVNQDYVALVNLAQYYQFMVDENGRLRKYIFEANVRDYQGHNAVNRDIQNTLVSCSKEDFWWLNNGVTIIADEVVHASKKELVLTEPDVVNGLQTSNEVFNYFQENPDRLASDNRNILIRIVVPEDEESRDKIILATNNQTNIPKSSLRANDPIHWQIELYLKNRGLYYDRRKNFYKNQGCKNAEIVSVSFLAQCMISLLLQKPNYARARPSTLLIDDETYNKLYTENQDLDVFYNAAKLGKQVELCIKQADDFTRAEKNDILFYVVYYSVANLTGRSQIRSSDIINLDFDVLTNDYILEIATIVFSEYKRLGGDGKVAKGPELIEALTSRLSATEK